MSIVLGIFTVALQITAFIVLWKQGKKVGVGDANAEIRRLRAERDLANQRLNEVLHSQALNADSKEPPIARRWFPEELNPRKQEPALGFSTNDGGRATGSSSPNRKKISVRPTPPPPPPRVPTSNFGGGHTTHHTHHDHLPGVVLGMAIHDALASSGDGCVVVPDYTNGPTQQGSSDVNLTEQNSCVDSAPAYEAPSYSATSYEPPSCSSSTDYSSGSTDYGCSDTSSSSSSFGD